MAEALPNNVFSLSKRRRTEYLDDQFEDLFASCWPEGASTRFKEELRAAFEAGYGLCEIDQRQSLAERIRRWLKP